MKKSHLIFSLFALMTLPNVLGFDVATPIHAQDALPSPVVNLEISKVRHDLMAEGYSEEMMNALFGEGNVYFPTTDEKLESNVLMVDVLIEQGQFDENDKPVMIFLAFAAHKKFNSTHLFTAPMVAHK